MLLSNRLMFGSICIFVAATVVQVARADASQQPVSTDVSVYYGDLNLDKTFGAETLVVRIEKAAERACGGRPSIGQSYRVVKARYEACVRKAEADAVTALNLPSVTAAYMGKNAPTTRIATR